MRVIALLEHHSMQDLLRAVETATQRGTNDPAAIALILQQETHPYHAAEPLHVAPGIRGCSRPVANLDSYDIKDLKEHT
jgi:hypothetical protein